MIKITLTLALLFPTAALAQQQRSTFRDASGRVTGWVNTDARGNSTFYDAAARNTGRSTIFSNGTTTRYDASGRRVGTTKQTGR
jgi:YD repeat-containing protein